MTLFDGVSWISSLNAIVGALMISLDLGRRTTGFGFVVMTLSSITWIAAALLDAQSVLITQNLVLLAVNLVGVHRWSIRRVSPR